MLHKMICGMNGNAYAVHLFLLSSSVIVTVAIPGSPICNPIWSMEGGASKTINDSVDSSLLSSEMEMFTAFR